MSSVFLYPTYAFRAPCLHHTGGISSESSASGAPLTGGTSSTGRSHRPQGAPADAPPPSDLPIRGVAWGGANVTGAAYAPTGRRPLQRSPKRPPARLWRPPRTDAPPPMCSRAAPRARRACAPVPHRKQSTKRGHQKPQNTNSLTKQQLQIGPARGTLFAARLAPELHPQDTSETEKLFLRVLRVRRLVRNVRLRSTKPVDEH